MEENEARPAQGYDVPTYLAPEGASWYHFLHGNVPGHQIDFIFRAEVPQGPLTRQHFSHLSRLMKYIEPQSNDEQAFAIANLSRDDTQYEAGHGGIAMIFGLRICGVTDHVGRQDPPFAHGIAAIDRKMDYATLLSTALSFHRHMFGRSGLDSPSSVLYREYVRCASEDSSKLAYVLKAYTADFSDLPQPPLSSSSLRWVTDGAAQPKRIVIVHPDGASFGDIVECAARVAAVLYQSDIRWTVISTGRESDVPGGVTVRFVAQRDAHAYESGGPVIPIDEVPDEDEDLARKLFNARGAARAAMEATGPVGGWRDRLKQRGEGTLPPPNGERPRFSPGEARDIVAGTEAITKDISPVATMVLEPGEIEIIDEPGAEESNPAPGAPAPVAAPIPLMVAAVAPAASQAHSRHESSLSRASTPGSISTKPINNQSNIEASPDYAPRSRAWVWLALVAACAVIIPLAYFAMFQDSPTDAESSADSSGPAPSSSTAGEPTKSAPPPSESSSSPEPTAPSSAGSSGASSNKGSSSGQGSGPASPTSTRVSSGGSKKGGGTIFDAPLDRKSPKKR